MGSCVSRGTTYYSPETPASDAAKGGFDTNGKDGCEQGAVSVPLFTPVRCGTVGILTNEKVKGYVEGWNGV
jgi:hypothetical protein